MAETPKKTTGELLAELQNTKEFTRYREENLKVFEKRSLSEDLSALLKEKNLKKADVIREAEMSDVFAYQIFSGLRKPSREKLLLLLIAMHLSFEETQAVLKRQGYGLLYAKNESDCVVIYGICHGYNVMKINELLYDLGLPILE